jgi:Na+-transporting methylmalonyl-CoA/oxaloacetate decarboxylase beta subunit
MRTLLLLLVGTFVFDIRSASGVDICKLLAAFVSEKVFEER